MPVARAVADAPRMLMAVYVARRHAYGHESQQIRSAQWLLVIFLALLIAKDACAANDVRLRRHARRRSAPMPLCAADEIAVVRIGYRRRPAVR